MSITTGNDSSLKRTFLEMQNEISHRTVFPQRHHRKKFSDPASLSLQVSPFIAICPKQRTVRNPVLSNGEKEHCNLGYWQYGRKNDNLVTDSLGDCGLDILTKNDDCAFESERLPVVHEVEMKDSSNDPSEKTLNKGSSLENEFRDITLDLSQLKGLYLRTF